MAFLKPSIFLHVYQIISLSTNSIMLDAFIDFFGSGNKH